MNEQKKVKINLDLEHIINKAVWAILVGICAFGVKKLSDVGDNIAELNKNVAIILTNLSEDKETLKDHEGRIRSLEHNKTHAPLGR